MEINIEGLSASYVPTEKANDKLERARKLGQILIGVAFSLILINFLVLVIKPILDNNSVPLSSVIVVINLLIVLLYLLVNEKVKKILKEDLKVQNRYEESRYFRVKYPRHHIFMMSMSMLQVFLQII